MELNRQIIKELISKGYDIISFKHYLKISAFPGYRGSAFTKKYNYNGKCIIKGNRKGICIYSIPYLIERGVLNGNCTDNNS